MSHGNQLPSGEASTSRPPNPNKGEMEPRRSQAGSVTHQPSPAVVASASHITTHVLPRRFIGGMPEAVAHSDEAQAKYERLKAVRQATLNRLSGVQDVGRRGSKMINDRRRSIVRSVRVRRRDQGGEEYDEDVQLQLSSDEEDEHGIDSKGKGKGKKKKKRKDVWVGESFDIGREFRSSATSAGDRQLIGSFGVSEVDLSQPGPSNVIGQQRQQTSQLSRPGVSSRQTTQESFVTARTRLSASSPAASRSSLHVDVLEEGYEVGETPRMSGSESSEPVPLQRTGNSNTSSLQPLIGDPPSTHSIKGKKKAVYDTDTRSVPNFRTRLKSAIRRPSGIDPRDNPHGSASPDQGEIAAVQGETGTVRGKSKTVQFPVELEHHIQDTHKSTPGNRAPADPGDVLSREGDEAAGTSAGAAEEAMEEEEDEAEDAILPGQVIMRDRMLVRVGYHRENNLTRYDEEQQRKKPCSRLEPMEEYLVVWRQGQVEFYQDWSAPFKERIKGYKRLCYLVPLSPTRSHLSIFNETDMTLCLTTSADKLSDDMERYLRSKTTRTTTMKDRVKQSKQAKWLKSGKKGTHVFIMKIAERSRAMDWYWEIWRELGGELPRRIDIVVPSLSTSVRLALPEEEDMVGSKSTCQAFSAKNTVKTSYDMISETTDIADLIHQRELQGGHLDLRLAWKSTDGNLDWVCWDTTTEGKGRDWALLAGVAKLQAELKPRTLQIRNATHRPRSIRLENGTVLEEPPGVEGYLIRHTGGATLKESVYLSTYDGCIYIALKTNAIPPLKPGKEGRTPADLFPDVHHEFLEAERRRSASYIEHTAGSVDLRDIEDIKMHDPSQTTPNQAKLKRPERCIDVRLSKTGVSIFETQSEDDAKEWVEKLEQLISYWKRRHRVDARLRMDAMALKNDDDPFGRGSEAVTTDLWDWCVIKGCRAVCMTGRLFVRKGKWTKFRSRLIVLTGGCLIAFKVKAGEPFHERKQRWPLFGAYTYSGMLAQDELHESGREDAFASRSRVYQDGLQSSDGLEDCTFCVRLAAKPSSWGKNRTQPWERMAEKRWATMPLTTTPPFILSFRTRSKLERDRWIWAINAEMERQVRDNVEIEEAHRNCGNVP